MKKIICFLMFLIFSISVYSNELLQGRSDLLNEKLNNGLDYYVLNNEKSSDSIVLMLYVKTGSCMETEDELGISHLIEHLSFQSTKNFKSQEIFDFIESIGYTKGNDINANTSYGNTYFYIKIPSGNQTYLNKAMLWLKDIASGNLLFDEDEVQIVKKTIIEEMRNEEGYISRFLDTVYDDYFIKGSAFQNRKISGSEESVNKITIQQLKDYYKKWYRIDNMAFIAVGNINPDKFKNTISNTFSDIKNPKTKLPEVDLSIPEQDSNVVIFKDKGYPSFVFEVYQKKHNLSYSKYKEDIYDEILFDYVQNAFYFRMIDLSNEKDAPFIQSSIGFETVIKPDNNYQYVSIEPKRNGLEQSIKILKRELLKIQKYGITKSEFNFVKKNRIYELNNKQEKKFSNFECVNRIMQLIQYGRPFTTFEYDSKLKLQMYNSITLEDVNNYCSTLFSDEKEIILINANSSININLSEEEIKKLWNEYEYVEYQNEQIDVPEQLMQRPDKKVGIKSIINNKELETKEYVLENGVHIITKKTDYEKGKVYFTGISEGGYSLYSDDDFSSLIAASIYSLNSGINGFSNKQLSRTTFMPYISINYSVKEYYEIIQGMAYSDFLEYLFQYTNLMFTNPYFTDEGWNNTVNSLSKESLNASTNDIFQKELSKAIWGDNYKHNIDWDKYINTMNQKRAEEIYREIFYNPAEFTFTFVGDFDERKLLDLCTVYLGSIPADETKKQKAKSNNITFGNGNGIKTIKGNNENVSEVLFIFENNLSQLDDPVEYQKRKKSLSILMSFICEEIQSVIREEKGGSYSIDKGVVINNYPDSYYISLITFNCKPGNEKEFIDDINKIIKKYQTEYITDEQLSLLKIKSNIILSKTNNQSCLNDINDCLIFKEENYQTITTTAYLQEFFTKKNVRKFFNEYFDLNNCTILINAPK